MRDFPAFIPRLIFRCRLCLSLTCAPCLPPGKLTCLLPPTSCSASASLVSVCSSGNDSSAWPRLPSCLLLYCASAFSDCSLATTPPACLRPLLGSLLIGPAARPAGSALLGASPASSSAKVSFSSSFPHRCQRDCVTVLNRLCYPQLSTAWLAEWKSARLEIQRPEFDSEHSTVIILPALYPVFCGLNKSHYQLFVRACVLHLGPKHTRFRLTCPYISSPRLFFSAHFPN